MEVGSLGTDRNVCKMWSGDTPQITEGAIQMLLGKVYLILTSSQLVYKILPSSLIEIVSIPWLRNAFLISGVHGLKGTPLGGCSGRRVRMLAQ